MSARGEVGPAACEAIVAEFVFGPMRCGLPATAEATDRTWGTSHPVCGEHAPRWNRCDHQCDPAIPEARRSDASHFLDCPVWASLGVIGAPTP